MRIPGVVGLWRTLSSLPAWLQIAAGAAGLVGVASWRVHAWHTGAIRAAVETERRNTAHVADSLERAHRAAERALSDSIARLDTVVSVQRKTARLSASHTNALAQRADSQADALAAILAERAHRSPLDTNAASDAYAARVVAATVRLLRDSVAMLNTHVTALDDSLGARDRLIASRERERDNVARAMATTESQLRASLARAEARPHLTVKNVSGIALVGYGIFRTVEFGIHQLRKP